MRHTAKILAAASMLALPAISNAAFIAFGTSADTAPNANPAITLAPGASTTLYIWADATGSNAASFINTFSFRVEGSGQSLTGSAFTWNTSATGWGGSTSASSAAGAPTANGMAFQVVGNTNGSAAADSGVNVPNAMRMIGSFNVTLPANATPSAVSNLFFVIGQNRLVESPTSGQTTNHAFGFGGNVTLREYSGLDGTGFTSTGAAAGGANGFPVTQAAGSRSSIPEATITVQAPVVNDFIDITAGGTAAADTAVSGSFASGYALTPIPGASGNTGSADAVFGNGNPGQVIAAFNLSGESGAILGLLPVAGSPFASTLVGYEYYKTFSAGTPGAAGSFTYNIAWDLPSGVAVTGLAVIPEPSALGLLAAAVPMLARRRRA